MNIGLLETEDNPAEHTSQMSHKYFETRSQKQILSKQEGSHNAVWFGYDLVFHYENKPFQIN